MQGESLSSEATQALVQLEIAVRASRKSSAERRDEAVEMKFLRESRAQQTSDAVQSHLLSLMHHVS